MSLALVRGIHRWPVNSPHKGPVTRKMFPFDDVIVITGVLACSVRQCWCGPQPAGDRHVYVRSWVVLSRARRRSVWMWGCSTLSGKCGTYMYSSTHWPLGDVAVRLKVWFSNSWLRIVTWALAAKLFSGECHRTLLMRSQPGLVSSGNKPLPDQCWLGIYAARWRNWDTMS